MTKVSNCVSLGVQLGGELLGGVYELITRETYNDNTRQSFALSGGKELPSVESCPRSLRVGR